MAQPPTKKSPSPEAPSQAHRSHGRGGAGNINNRPASTVDTTALSTPTLKGSNYTTGRGGSGNIVGNDNPVTARAAQDVEAPAHHEREARGTYHWGRGGEGNMMTLGKSGAQEAREKGMEQRRASKERLGLGERRGSFKEAFEKGKEMLGLGGKKVEKGKESVEKVPEDAVAA